MKETLDSLNWGPTKIVPTKAGEKAVRSAEPNTAFWGLWKTHKAELKSQGYSVGKFKEKWSVTHWSDPQPAEEKEEALHLSRASDLDIEIPAPYSLDYLPYQKAGIAFASQRDNSLIADEMGLGKTIQAIGVINLDKTVKSALVICPASLRLNWKRELEKWLIRGFSIGVVDKNDYPDTDIVIINYDVLERHKERLNGKVWDILVLDEAHYLKNPKAKRTKMVFGGKEIDAIPAKRKVFLTGTPILNRPMELFPIINALDPERWPNFFSYARRYCAAVRNAFGWDFTGASNLEELQDRLRSTIMVRRLKSEVLTELPPKRRQVIELEPDSATKKVISQESDQWDRNSGVIESLRLAVELAKISDKKEDYLAAVGNLKEGMTAAFTEMAIIRQQIALAKVPYVVEHLKNASGKVIIFAHHKSVIAELQSVLGDEAVNLTGDTKMEDRQAAVDAFQNDDRIKFFIGSIKAAGVGLTLTASSHVVFAELDWVPGSLSQAEDRAHRIGQRESVLVQHLVLEGSLDAVMAQTLVDKQEVIDRALDRAYTLEIVSPDKGIKLPSFEDVEKEAEEEISDAEKKDLLKKIQKIAALDPDQAATLNMVGFNRFDTKLGHSLASQNYLSNKQAVLARKLVHKYRRQLE